MSSPKAMSDAQYVLARRLAQCAELELRAGMLVERTDGMRFRVTALGGDAYEEGYGTAEWVNVNVKRHEFIPCPPDWGTEGVLRGLLAKACWADNRELVITQPVLLDQGESRHVYTVTASWPDERGVWVTETDACLGVALGKVLLAVWAGQSDEEGL